MTQWGLDTLFNPAKRHMDEEKRRLQSTREQLADSSGGKRIDLESGKVRIRRDGTEEPDAHELGTDGAGPEEIGADGRPAAEQVETRAETSAAPVQTAAQARAQARRRAARTKATAKATPAAEPTPSPE